VEARLANLPPRLIGMQACVARIIRSEESLVRSSSRPVSKEVGDNDEAG
jgi:hypothetical protein